MNLPRPIRKLIESFEKLPGIGPKSAARLTFYLLHVPQEQLDEFANSLTGLKKNLVKTFYFYRRIKEVKEEQIFLDLIKKD